MGIFSIFKGGNNYFDKKITPKCEYCQNGKRTNAGDKILCEIKALVDPNYSCNKFIYSPLKRIPVKQLNSVGILGDESLYLESAGDRAEKEEESKAESQNNAENNESETVVDSDESEAETNNNDSITNTGAGETNEAFEEVPASTENNASNEEITD